MKYLIYLLLQNEIYRQIIFELFDVSDDLFKKLDICEQLLVNGKICPLHTYTLNILAETFKKMDLSLNSTARDPVHDNPPSVEALLAEDDDQECPTAPSSPTGGGSGGNDGPGL